MIVRFFNADKDVCGALARAVASMPKFLLLTQLKGPRTLAIEAKSPVKEVLATAGNYLDVVVVIDDGSPEGMWRDPFGELCDRLFPERKDASAATSGWVLTQGGQALGYFRKSLWDPVEDAETITSFLSQYIPGMVAFSRKAPQSEPEPVKKAAPVSSAKRTKTPVINQAVNPGAGRRRDTPIMGTPGAGKRRETPIMNRAASGAGPRPTAARGPTRPARDPEAELRTQEIPRVVVEEPKAAPPPPPPPPAAPPPEPPPMDPYAILGVQPGVTFDEVKKTYRALIIQYHPDKVAHMAPEFRELAEKRTRDLNEAFQMLEKALKS